MHGDAALDAAYRVRADAARTLQGEANLLVLPNIDAANIAYNLLKTAAGGGIAIGPVLLGAAKPVHVLTPSATVRRIVNMTALTVADAKDVDVASVGCCRCMDLAGLQLFVPGRCQGAIAHRVGRCGRPGRPAGRSPRHPSTDPARGTFSLPEEGRLGVREQGAAAAAAPQRLLLGIYRPDTRFQRPGCSTHRLRWELAEGP
jgi:hypothetical protein